MSMYGAGRIANGELTMDRSVIPKPGMPWTVKWGDGRLWETDSPHRGDSFGDSDRPWVFLSRDTTLSAERWIKVNRSSRNLIKLSRPNTSSLSLPCVTLDGSTVTASAVDSEAELNRLILSRDPREDEAKFTIPSSRFKIALSPLVFLFLQQRTFTCSCNRHSAPQTVSEARFRGRRSSSINFLCSSQTLSISFSLRPDWPSGTAVAT